VALTQPDLGVLRKAQRGDERAFSLILRAYETPVFNYVLRLVGDRSLATVKWRIYKAREEVQLALAREGITFGMSAVTADASV
jgi:DNA-directed RNA polymerase specialized sigma24 family protein